MITEFLNKFRRHCKEFCLVLFHLYWTANQLLDYLMPKFGSCLIIIIIFCSMGIFFLSNHLLAVFYDFKHSCQIQIISTQLYCFKYFYLIIIIMLCREHGYPWPSLATSPYHSLLLAGLQGYIPNPHIAAGAGHPAFAWPYVWVQRSTSLMSSSLLLQLCPACLVHLTCIVFVTGGRWPYSWCLVGCCHQDLFNIAHSILV